MLGLDNIEFPLLFTDNAKTDPKLEIKTFSEYCKILANKGIDGKEPWQSPTENGRQKGYTPCPPDLMHDRDSNP